MWNHICHALTFLSLYRVIIASAVTQCVQRGLAHTSVHVRQSALINPCPACSPSTSVKRAGEKNLEAEDAEMASEVVSGRKDETSENSRWRGQEVLVLMKPFPLVSSPPPPVFFQHMLLRWLRRLSAWLRNPHLKGPAQAGPPDTSCPRLCSPSSFFRGLHGPSQAQIPGQNPRSWQARVCCEGPPDFVGASECLIANWLN